MNSKDKTGVSDTQEHSDRARVSLRQNWWEGGLSKALEDIRGEGRENMRSAGSGSFPKGLVPWAGDESRGTATGT